MLLVNFKSEKACNRFHQPIRPVATSIKRNFAVMKICVISDLHCKHQQIVGDTTDTLLISNKPRLPRNQHPVSSLLHIIKQEKIEADVLLCPGDLGDKADEQGISSSWTFLEEIKLALKAKHLIGIPGNHDINSRKLQEKDPFAFIKFFHENFPVSDEDLKSRFWSTGYCVINVEDVLFLLINTVFDHTDKVKAEQASINPSTLEKIREELTLISTGDFKNKVCVLHHHPIKHSNIKNWKDTDSLDKGDDLIALLNELNFSVIIHGHKHQPRIVEYNGLPIFAAGSFASFANLQATGINTMFHMLELKEMTRTGMIHSWEFDIQNGWTQNLNKYFPPRIGFGSDRNLEELAGTINKLFDDNSRKALLFEEIVASLPELQYIIPEKLLQLNHILKTSYRIKTVPELPNDPIKISELIN
jgi:predicted phosphodiesterase